MASGMEAPQRGPSIAWYIVPILFGIIGGLIMYFAIRHRDPKMAQKGFWVGVIVFILTIVLSVVIGAAAIFYEGELFESDKISATESVKLSNLNLWMSPDGRSSAGAMVVTNQGFESVTINSIIVRGIPQAYGTWYYNKIDAVPPNINMPLRPDYTPFSVNVDADPMEEPFIPATQPVVLESNQSVILYLSNPGRIQGDQDRGNTYTVAVQTDKATKKLNAVVMPG